MQKYIQDNNSIILNTLTVSEEDISDNSLESFCNIFLLTEVQNKNIAVEKFIFCDTQENYNKISLLLKQSSFKIG